jgi:hypothetical protein
MLRLRCTVRGDPLRDIGGAMALTRDSNVPDADAHYAALIDAHADLSHDDSVALNARLVLLLANHIGDLDVLQEAIAVARKSLSKAR